MPITSASIIAPASLRSDVISFTSESLIDFAGIPKRFGSSVRYAQDKTAHLKTEFGFNAVHGRDDRYASRPYHNFIRFKVSKSLLETAYPTIPCGVELEDVLPLEDLAISS